MTDVIRWTRAVRLARDRLSHSRPSPSRERREGPPLKHEGFSSQDVTLPACQVCALGLKMDFPRNSECPLSEAALPQTSHVLHKRRP